MGRRTRSRRRDRGGPEFSGVLAIDKPVGVTSHDVVDFVRTVLDQHRVGHGGTLDPLASGVLPLLLGPAARLTENLNHDRKEYRTRATLEYRTPTGDAATAPEAHYTGDPVSRDRVEATLATFLGDIEQAPHRYSAVRVGGRRLYERARAGEVLEPGRDIPLRTVHIESLRILSYSFPILELEIACGKGTYIRSLVEDIGTALGTGGSLLDLRRTRVGGLDLDGAWTPFELTAAAIDGAVSRARVPWTQVFPDSPLLQLEQEILRDHVRCGRPLPFPTPDADTPLLVLDAGELIALYRQDPADPTRSRPLKVLVSSSQERG